MKFDKYEYGKDFIFKDNRVHFTKSGMSKNRRFKKITGSRIGSILGHDDFRTPFQTWCAMFGFFTEESNEYFLKAGREIEDRLRKHAERMMGKKYIEHKPMECGFDVFPEDDVFGGIPDGEEVGSDGNIVSMIEIKSAQLDKYKWIFEENQFKLYMRDNKKPVIVQKGAGLKKWFCNGFVKIPQSYKDQLSLYMYLRGVKEGYFCVAFMSQEDYEDPKSVVFNSEFNNYKNYDEEGLSLLANEERILVWEKHTVDFEEFGKEIERARKWYEDHIRSGVSPELTSKDLSWFRYGYPQIR